MISVKKAMITEIELIIFIIILDPIKIIVISKILGINNTRK